MRYRRRNTLSALIMFFLLASILLSPAATSNYSSNIELNGVSERTKAPIAPESEPHLTFLDGMQVIFPKPQIIVANDTVVSVTPEHVAADFDETFNIAVTISNVSNLYGFEIQLHWDTTILEYTSHIATTPVEAYPNGVLHHQALQFKDEVNASTGTYWIAFASLNPAPSFNGTGTAFEMTFRVVGYGSCLLDIYLCNLASYDAKPIAHSVQNGHATAGVLTLPTNMPVVFVDPLNLTADVGESFTVSAKVFNLSGSFYTTQEAWEEGKPLPPPEPTYWRYNLSLGHLYAFDLGLSWDPTILEYVSHTVMVPVEDYVDGILHEPIIEAADTVDPVAGTYRLARSSQAPALAFNAPDANATVFTMTFSVKKQGKCDISFTNVDLVVDLVGLGFPFSVPQEIPHWTTNGRFQTSELFTRIEKVNAGALVAGSLYDPSIQGENVTANIIMKNDGPFTDTYNLSLYDETTLLAEWQNEELDPEATKAFTHTIGGLTLLGVHTITAKAAILHESEVRTDEMSAGFTIVDTPALQVNGPSSAAGGQTLVFDASASYHKDPYGQILDYSWTLWAPGEIFPRDTKTGMVFAFSLPFNPKEGNWTVMLVVKDSYNLTAMTPAGTRLLPTSELSRPATEPYRKNLSLQVTRAQHDLAASAEIPDLVKLKETVSLNATVSNRGLSNEANVKLQLLINGDTAASTVIPALNTDASYTLSHPWIPTVEGIYNITAYVTPVLGEDYTTNNRVTALVSVIAPIISPEEGQYANYLATMYNGSYQMPGSMKWNFTYLEYVTPCLMNLTMWQESGGYYYYYYQWVLVNVLNREMSGGTYPPQPEYFYFGWIETNITVGSKVRLLDTYGTVRRSQLIEAAGRQVDCWVVEMIMSGHYDFNYTMWYDKATGLWLGMRYCDSYNPDLYSLVMLLVDTNVSIGGALRIETDKPMYERLELATTTATYAISNTPVPDATITLQVNYPNGTLYFIWAVTTDANGTASFIFLIEETAPYGTYTLDASAYKLGLAPRTASATFIVGHLEPNVEMRFEGLDVALIEHSTTILLSVCNTGNGTAYNMTTTLIIPGTLTILSANTTFSGTMNPEQGIILVAVVTASMPGRHLLTASTTYSKINGTIMPTVYAEKAIAFAYHEEYPADLTSVTITATQEQITVNLTIANYGDSPIQVTLIASAQHIASKLMLQSAYQTITINPNEEVTISLLIAMPSASPSGEYLVQGILATQLPSQNGFTLVRRQETVII